MARPLIVDKLLEHGLEYLEKDPDGLGLDHKLYDEGLLVLNYSQINSPKVQLANECRGLIIEWPSGKVVCRSFDRFFNYGENFTDFSHKDEILEKLDGSLIKVYYYDGQWHASTRKSAFAESTINDNETSFRSLVDRCLVCDLQDACRYLHTEYTYSFELCTPLNRVVRLHTDYFMYYLACRHNETGEYGLMHHEINAVAGLGALLPVRYQFDTVEACIESAKALPDLEEGYVAYRDGVPICKVKSPKYVAAHRIFTGEITTKKIVELVVANEQSEFLTYFPEYLDQFNDVSCMINNSLVACNSTYESLKWQDLDQKSFAMCIKDHVGSQLYFLARRNDTTPLAEFWKLDYPKRVKLAMAMIEREERWI